MICFQFKLSIFVAILQVLKFEFQKFRILEILNFHPLVRGDLDSRANLMPIYGDLYQIKL